MMGNTASRIFAESAMYNIRTGYENDWLNMLDRVEFNLNCQQPCRLLLPNKYKVYFQRNDWLNYGRVLDKVLPGLTGRECLCQKRHDDGPLAGRGERFLGFLRTLQLARVRNVNRPDHRKLYQEYKQQEEHIIPTLARIHRRIKARHEAAGIKSECILTEDETLAIALRAILKRRNGN
ncbi:hypothetical protein AAGQ96_20270 [Pantoea sp. MBD-2R]|uniref:hypothetical protein n=1 Tax=Pantoea sp. MBD-2R TaxID=3141540 RepID=UPI00318370D6